MVLVEHPKFGLTNKVYKFILLFIHFIFPFPYRIDVLFCIPKTTSDPIFEEINSKLSFAEMSDDMKDFYSHRGKAIKKLIPDLVRIFD